MHHEVKIAIYIVKDKDRCYIRSSYAIKIVIYIKANKKKSLAVVRFEPKVKDIKNKGSNRYAIVFE